MKNKFLSLAWFKETAEHAITNVIEKKLEKLIEEDDTPLDRQCFAKPAKPYLNVKLVNDTITIVLNDGAIISCFGTEEDYYKILDAKSEEEIYNITTSEEIKQENIRIEKETKKTETLLKGIELLNMCDDFIVEENTVYLKGISRSLPQLLVERFVEIIDNYSNCPLDYLQIALAEDAEYKAHKNFFMWCCLNPNAQSAEDLYGFLSKHKMKIDKHGNFYAYRRVKTIESGNNKELVDFISNAYNKVKAVWKKNPKNYEIWKNVENSKDFTLMKVGDMNRKEFKKALCYVGNLETLYLELPNMKENRYTDAHTETMDYRIGEVASIPRNDCDENNSVSCSKGLHIANKEYDYSGFGDQDILAIINPMDCIAVPKGEIGKLRTCRWFFAMTLSKDEKYILDEECFDVTELGNIFNEKCFDNLEEYIKKGYSEEIKRHTFSLPTISSKEINSIVLSLNEMKDKINNRVVSIK